MRKFKIKGRRCKIRYENYEKYEAKLEEAEEKQDYSKQNKRKMIQRYRIGGGRSKIKENSTKQKEERKRQYYKQMKPADKKNEKYNKRRKNQAFFEISFLKYFCIFV